MSTIKRIQLDTQPQSLARLQELRDKTEATSYAEVVKKALRLYAAVVDEAEAGGTFFVRSADGTTTEYRIF